MDLPTPLVWAQWSPFRVSLESTGSIHAGTFRCGYRFMLGSSQVLLRRYGCYVTRAGHPDVYLLDGNTYRLLEALDAPRPAGRQAADFALLHRYAVEAGAELDAYFRGHDAVPIPAPIAAAPPPEDGAGRLLWEADILDLPAADLEEAVACLYEKHAYRAVLMPVGNNLGAAVVAVREGRACAVHVDPRTSEVRDLSAALAARYVYRGELRVPVDLAVVTRGSIAPALRAMNLDFYDGVRLADAVEGAGISVACLEHMRSRRCRNFGEGVARLRECLRLPDAA